MAYVNWALYGSIWLKVGIVKKMLVEICPTGSILILS
jgi:hypothetical protein